jgi:hypothetical protein
MSRAGDPWVNTRLPARGLLDRAKLLCYPQMCRPIAWFAYPEPLRGGWAWGQPYLNGAVAAEESDFGKGKIYLFGPEITFRGQPNGTFKFLFNAIYLAGATPVRLP